MKITLPKFLKGKTQSKKVSSFKKIYPEREWLLGLLLALIVLGSGAAYAHIVYINSLENPNGETLEVTESSRILYDQRRVSEVLTEYRSRAERFNTLRKDAPVSMVSGSASTTQIVEGQGSNASSTQKELQTGGVRVE